MSPFVLLSGAKNNQFLPVVAAFFASARAVEVPGWDQDGPVTDAPKIRELIAELERAGVKNRGGRGSHRNFVHPRLSKPITISGKLGDDAKPYQVRTVRRAIMELDK